MREVNNICPVCGEETMDDYMVTDECWAEAGFTFYQNVHLHCLAETLDRLLVLDDFPDCPVNFDIAEVLHLDVIRLPQDLGNRLDRQAKVRHTVNERKRGNA